MQAQLNEELAARARRIYDEKIKAQVEPAHIGKFVAVDVESGDWEMDAEVLPASRRLRARRPGGSFFLLRAGHRTAVDLSGHIRVQRP